VFSSNPSYSPEKQNFAGVSELVFQSSNNFAFYDEVFLKFAYSERPVAP
jgi:hypothetical protein